MCGINGIISYKDIGQAELQRQIGMMNDLIFHRGPDDDGTFMENSGSVNLAMGMRRLSIIDLHSGQQPIFSEDKNQVIVFNGEIYNYQELRAELKQKGVRFKTKSDTEVILQLYRTEGIAGFKKLDGMFGFSIYDKVAAKVFIGRDFFGEKPLYYTSNENGFYWASELKSITRVMGITPPISKTGLNLFFRLTYIPAPFTIYDRIEKLRPNHLLVFDLAKKSWQVEEIQSYDAAEKASTSIEEAKVRVKELVAQSVESRSVSDVPIGTFLSGGVDSSIVSLCLARQKEEKINTFSIGFENKGYDETDKSRVVANMIGSNHREFILNEKDLESNVHAILNNFDEPFADSSSLPSYLVAHQTSKHVKVALTGDGGDEVFGGYNKYYMGAINKKYTRIIPKPMHNLVNRFVTPNLRSKKDIRGYRFKLNRLLTAIDYGDGYYWDIISLGFSGDTLLPYLSEDHLDLSVFDYFKKVTGYPNPNNLTEYREVDRHVSLEGDMLVKVDRTSMLNSLECRAPFLNKNIWEYTNSLPESYLMNGWDKKHILKKAFESDFPEGFLDKPKSGFGVPIGDWLRSSLKTELLQYTERTLLDSQGIFNSDSIQKLVKDHLNGKDHTFKIWSFFCFQKWYVNQYQPVAAL